nr:hypothetical protein [Tanacetum cinerariifolium]
MDDEDQVDEDFISLEENSEENAKRNKGTHDEHKSTSVVELKKHKWKLPKELLDLPGHLFSVQSHIYTLEALPDLLNKVADTLNRFASILNAHNKGVPLAGKSTASPVKGEKNTNPVTKDVKLENLADHISIYLVEEYHKKKLLYNKYCDKTLKRKKSPKITNCEVLTKKGPITLKIYREDGSEEVISNRKVNDRHLAEWREVIQACLDKSEKGWKTIYAPGKTRLDQQTQTEQELNINLSKPIKEQDHLNELNELANKKRKRASDFSYEPSPLKIALIVIPRCLRHSSGDLILYQAYGNLYAMTALGWLLEEIHVTWAYLGKKRMRLQLYTKVKEDKGTQTLETASQLFVTASDHQRDGVKKIKTPSGLNRHSKALEDLAKRQPLGWLLEEIHVTWAYLGKKRTRLQLYTKVKEDKGTQTLETASQLFVTASDHQRDGVKKIKTPSGLNRHSKALEDLAKRQR